MVQMWPQRAAADNLIATANTIMHDCTSCSWELLSGTCRRAWTNSHVVRSQQVYCWGVRFIRPLYNTVVF